ncbi:hypothetical protein VP01_55g4 [Puccinia sorghi]|uniref:Uncharacterized protein n=1 Tax=Puccinia sorghi TaxID=27349 RepID=A0A0L6UJ11_9BASI|nr:hypothetical protein VP01_55g4 [Puccinia sorghi]
MDNHSPFYDWGKLLLTYMEYDDQVNCFWEISVVNVNKIWVCLIVPPGTERVQKLTPDDDLYSPNEPLYLLHLSRSVHFDCTITIDQLINIPLLNGRIIQTYNNIILPLHLPNCHNYLNSPVSQHPTNFLAKNKK